MNAQAATVCGDGIGCAMIAQQPLPPRPATVMTIAKPDFIEGIAKGMAVLESFDTERQRLNATLAAERAGLTRAAARRHLLTLAHLGYLESDGSYFGLAPKVLRFSGSYLASARLPRVLQPTLNRLAGCVRCTDALCDHRAILDVPIFSADHDLQHHPHRQGRLH